MQIRMVSAGIYEELALLCCFFLVGVFLAASYDILRILRGIFLHGTFLINLEDLLYWIYVTIVVFVELYEKNDGRLMCGSNADHLFHGGFCRRNECC